MRQKKVWRYWCDFCRKGGCSRSAMILHEKRCTLNPDRECGVCKSERLSGHSLASLRVLARNQASELTGGDDFDMEPATSHEEILGRLSDAADGCPACILAALRQCKLTDAEPRFDYPKEMQEFWKQKRADEDYADMMANCH